MPHTQRSNGDVSKLKLSIGLRPPSKGGRIEHQAPASDPHSLGRSMGLLRAILYIEYNIFLGAFGPPDPPGGVLKVGPFHIHNISFSGGAPAPPDPG